MCKLPIPLKLVAALIVSVITFGRGDDAFGINELQTQLLGKCGAKASRVGGVILLKDNVSQVCRFRVVYNSVYNNKTNQRCSFQTRVNTGELEVAVFPPRGNVIYRGVVDKGSATTYRAFLRAKKHSRILSHCEGRELQ